MVNSVLSPPEEAARIFAAGDNPLSREVSELQAPPTVSAGRRGSDATLPETPVSPPPTLPRNKALGLEL